MIIGMRLLRVAKLLKQQISEQVSNDGFGSDNGDY